MLWLKTQWGWKADNLDRDDIDIKQALFEQDKIKEMMATEGARILFSKLQIVADEARKRGETHDPYTEPHKIMKGRITAYVIEDLMVQILEGVINYNPDTIDNQESPQEKWSFKQWFIQAVKSLKIKP